MHVDRCICAGVTFAELRAIAEAEQLDFPKLKRRTGACAGCGMCTPYVREMLATGATAFRPVPRGQRPQPLAPHLR